MNLKEKKVVDGEKELENDDFQDFEYEEAWT
jgi:hypothetical protein